MESHAGGAPMSELTPVLKAYLLEAGTQGRKQSEIFKRLQYIPREDVLSELNALWAEEKVQRFTLKPNLFVWRATDNFNV
jgi:hypothetical protein